MKRHLDDLQGRLTQEEISAISEAMELYDGAIRTGSEIVDTVLCQKKLICDKQGVALSFVCDGAAVRFMEPSRFYSLLDNALENAIEAVTALPKDERLISLSISAENGGARIEVSNYFDPSVAVENGTSKSDKSRHGYGLKSMRYVAESCGGEVKTETAGNMFFLTITLPNK
ncbi:MAG: ATP-binding protein [Oscillospiraceae bacterium]|nr:ATP-binding protein [Oscillospiraceae bacterium]